MPGAGPGESNEFIVSTVGHRVHTAFRGHLTAYDDPCRLNCILCMLLAFSSLLFFPILLRTRAQFFLPPGVNAAPRP